jgi:hypothetical protein
MSDKKKPGAASTAPGKSIGEALIQPGNGGQPTTTGGEEGMARRSTTEIRPRGRAIVAPGRVWLVPAGGE